MPRRFCDLVMKGGITSGVVYPSAACKLSESFIFKNIGGTSAGAIAAALTAAAEYGRDKPGAGFDELAKLPAWLGGAEKGAKQSNLLSLFQPQSDTEALFRIVLAFIGAKKGRWLRRLWAAWRGFPWAGLAGLIPGSILVGLSLKFGSGALLLWGVFCGLLLIGICIPLFLAIAAVCWAKSRIPANMYGLCDGCGRTDPTRPAPLAEWLADRIDALAGRSDPARPLTFGDLWGTEDEEAERKINLLMMTTNLTHGRPYRVPFETGIFFFNEHEFAKLFPARIVTWMKEHSKKSDSTIGDGPFYPMPQAADLPVVVGARLSLSFPILISAVPLYAVDYSRERKEDQVLEKCWFSDGGISSNFPVHFFDQPLPDWPTFALNLRELHPDHEDKKVWMPEKNLEAIGVWWRRFEEPAGKGNLVGFLGAIKDAMQNWADNAQTRLPGYRDRIAHISLGKKEGGLHLNMPKPMIDELTRRGELAATKLTDRFAAGASHELSWSNHRWVRYRSAMSMVEKLLTGLSESYDGEPAAGDATYEELIRRGENDLPKSYQWDGAQKAFAIEMTERIVQIGREMIGNPESFSKQSPKPEPDIRITPRI